VITQVGKHDKNKDSKLDDAEMLALLKEATGSANITQEIDTGTYWTQVP
jgi:hypothetical protein